MPWHAPHPGASRGLANGIHFAQPRAGAWGDQSLEGLELGICRSSPFTPDRSLWVIGRGSAMMNTLVDARKMQLLQFADEQDEDCSVPHAPPPENAR